MNGSTLAVLILFAVLMGSGVSGLSFDRLTLDEEEVGTVLSLSGDVSVRRGGTVTFVNVGPGYLIPSGATLRTGNSGRVVVSLLSGEQILVEPDTEIYFDSSVLASGVESVVLNVEQGGVKLQAKASGLAGKGLNTLVGRRTALEVRSGSDVLAARDVDADTLPARFEIKLDEGVARLAGRVGAFRVSPPRPEGSFNDPDPLRQVDSLLRKQEQARARQGADGVSVVAMLAPAAPAVPSQPESTADWFKDATNVVEPRSLVDKLEEEAPLKPIAPFEPPPRRPVVKQARQLNLLALVPADKQGFVPVTFETPLPRELILGGTAPVNLVAQAGGFGWVSRVESSAIQNELAGQNKQPVQLSLEDEAFRYDVRITEPGVLTYPLLLRLNRARPQSGAARAPLPGRYVRLADQLTKGSETLDLRVMKAADLQGPLSVLLLSASEVALVQGRNQMTGKRHFFARNGKTLFEVQGELTGAEVKSLGQRTNAGLHYIGEQGPRTIASLTAEDYARLWAAQFQFVRLECAGKERLFPRQEFLSRHEEDMRAMLRNCEGIVLEFDE